jgi:hypothetical protein
MAELCLLVLRLVRFVLRTKVGTAGIVGRIEGDGYSFLGKVNQAGIFCTFFGVMVG